MSPSLSYFYCLQSFLQFYQAYLNGGSSAQGFAQAFQRVAEEDKLWMIWFLKGGKPKRIITKKELKKWGLEYSQVPEWLFEESYRRVKDTEHTVSAILPAQSYSLGISLDSFMTEYAELDQADIEQKKAWVLNRWEHLDRKGISFFNKLIVGSLRIKMTHAELSEGLGAYLKRNSLSLMHRLKKEFDPCENSFESVFLEPHPHDEDSLPLPFPGVENSVTLVSLKKASHLFYEYDGLRCQLIKRNGTIFLWSENDLITEYFPAVKEFEIPDEIVLQGQLIFKKGKNIQASSIFVEILKGRKLKTDSFELQFVFECILENNGVVEAEFNLPKAMLKKEERILTPEKVVAKTEKDFKNCFDKMREHQAIAIRIVEEKKQIRIAAPKLYVDAVLVYAQRTWSNLYDTLSFAVWDEDELLTLTKASHGLSEEEFEEISAWVKEQDGERIGPVRMVEAERVFQLSMDKIEVSKRTKSGLKITNPTIEKEYKLAKKEHAFSLAQVKALLPKT